jgi:hypothetical protein
MAYEQCQEIECQRPATLPPVILQPGGEFVALCSEHRDQFQSGELTSDRIGQPATIDGEPD